MEIWKQIAIAFFGMSLIMSLAWLVQRRLRDAALVDGVWALGVGALAIFFACMGSGYAPRRVLIGVLAGLWSARLAAYLFARLARLARDGRYERLRREWGKRWQSRLFGFFQIQASWSVLFALPMLLAAQNPSAPLGVLDGLAVVIWLVAVAGESLADLQLNRFRSRPENEGKVCRSGLWRYSRHPNYFFEWLHWWTYVPLSLPPTIGLLSVAGPVVMLIFLLRITGIPPSEAQALASRGEAYRVYQRTTSIFFPWPPRKRREKP